MNWSAVGAASELLGAIAVVVSLIYLAAQVRANTRQARLEAARDLAVRISEISIAIATSREVGELFHRGGGAYHELDGVDQLRYRGLLNALFRGLEQQFLLRGQGALGDDEWRTVQRIIADFTSLPGVQQYFVERGQWYSAGFLEIVRRATPLKNQATGPAFADQYHPKRTDDEAASV